MAKAKKTSEPMGELVILLATEVKLVSAIGAALARVACWGEGVMLLLVVDIRFWQYSESGASC